MMQGTYPTLLSELNGYPPGAWLIEPGQGFGSDRKWWAHGGPRTEAHNGLDLRAYEPRGGELIYVDGSVRVPAALGGKIVNIFKDFLGFSLFVAHDRQQDGTDDRQPAGRADL